MLRFERIITAIDTHTGGEPTRTIIGGLPRIQGKTVSEKMVYMRDHMDWIRTMLMYEPRGHSVMSGAIITEPSDPRADIGVIYIETGGYLPMCGHDTIGCCTALIEMGVISASEPITKITLETPAGLVTAKATVENGIVRSVTFRNIPSFLYMADVEVKVPELGNVTLDIAYGGNFYAIVDAEKIGVNITPENAREIIGLGRSIKDAVNNKYTIQHPERPYIQGLTHVEFSGSPTHKEAHAKNTVLITHDALDRSPCGTGTSAKLAVLYAKGQISINQEFVHESIIGSLFRAKVVEECQIAGCKAIVPEITGSAYITGIHQFVVDPDDPLKMGFLIPS